MEPKKKKRVDLSKDSEQNKEVETEDIYNDEQREEMLKDDEITAAEDGFMRGREISPKNVKRLKKSNHEDSVSVELAKNEYQDD